MNFDIFAKLNYKKTDDKSLLSSECDNNSNLPQQKKYMTIETWGCQMNVADSEAFITYLKPNYELCEDPNKSDLIILNTCHIRDKADHKVISRLGKLALIKKTNSKLKIVLAGCIAQAAGKKLLSRFRVIDILIGPGQIHQIADLIDKHNINKKRNVSNNKNNQLFALGFDYQKKTSHNLQRKDNKQLGNHTKINKQTQQNNTNNACKKSYDVSTVHPGKNPVSRFVTIQQGCNNYCSFCVVPFTRGAEVSVPYDQIESTVAKLLHSSAKEICLLGQNVNSYGLDLIKQSDNVDNANNDNNNLYSNSIYKGLFYQLLNGLLQRFQGKWRLRFTTSNPHDLTKGVCDLFKIDKRLGRYFHLPVQSGSDPILSAMKRKVTVKKYKEKIHWLRSACEDMAISTDIIVGFPGESADDFERTCDLVQYVRYSFIYAFAYSKRKHTPAQRFNNQIDEKIKKKRLNHLLDIQKNITNELHLKTLDSTLEVLFIYRSSKQDDCYYGRSCQYYLVKVKSKHNLIGKFYNVRINKASITTLEGTLESSSID